MSRRKIVARPDAEVEDLWCFSRAELLHGIGTKIGCPEEPKETLMHTVLREGNEEREIL